MIKKDLHEKFWQWLADIFFYKVWLNKKRKHRDWGLWSYYICIDAKWKRKSLRETLHGLRVQYKHRKEGE